MKPTLFLIAMASTALAAAHPALAQRDTAPASEQAPSLSPAQMDRYVGYYQLTRYALVHIYRLGDGLRLAYPGAEQDDVKLVPEGGTTFKAPEYTRPIGAKAEMRQAEGRITFMVDANGNATGLVLRVFGKAWPAPRIAREKAFSMEVALRQHRGLRIESPGTRKFLTNFIKSIQAGAPDYSGMTPTGAASEMRGQDAARIASLGPLKRIFAVVVTNDGNDRYTAMFAKGPIDFLVPP